MKFDAESRAARILACFLILGCGAMSPHATRAADLVPPTPSALAADLSATVRPFVQTYCASCHGPEKSKGDLDLTPYTSVDAIAKDLRRWELLRERLQNGDMPPDQAKRQPSAAERADIVRWITSLRTYEAKRHAGDPGPVYVRRLSNAEYDNTLRDLTGVDLHPAHEFPVDPANEAGFDNSGESLTMTPGLLKKYLQAARDVADHLVLKPDGLAFAPHPVVAETDRDKYCVNRIIQFYHRQDTDYADYFLAAWRYQNRAALGQPDATLADVAHQSGVSPRYFAIVWSTLTRQPETIGPIAALQSLWRQMPAGNDVAAAQAAAQRMRSFVLGLRPKFVPHIGNLTSPQVNDGSQALVLWKDRQMAAYRRSFGDYSPFALLRTLPADAPPAVRQAMAPALDPARDFAFESGVLRFCSVFPDTFYVSERARVFLNDASEKDLVGRFLSAGFHNQMGYFRDDGPLYDLVLDDVGRQELNALWKEFDFTASIPQRQYASFIWYERAESFFMMAPQFNSFRAEDKNCTSEPEMRRLEKVYLDTAIRAGAGKVAQQAMHEFFNEMSSRVRAVEAAAPAAEVAHLRDLVGFAQRAYRRPLTDEERRGLLDFYRNLKDHEGLTHEDAVRDTLASILMSPSFCYRLDLPRAGGTGVAGGAVRPLDDLALANRLSYFLWASMPDRELLDLAAAGRLHEPVVLKAQATRLLRDPRARGFAIEFAGNWLDFRRFEEHNGVDRRRFPTFTNDLRQAMFDEPIRFFLDVAQHDRPILDFLYGDYTLVNPVLAKHYGMPLPAQTAADQWLRVDNAGKYGRGGLLPMAVFLTNNSPGLRTSPVKRGHWVVKQLLGEHIPAPPATVPQLPSDERKLGDLTLREALARHRATKTCAVCHERFDSMGLVFEGYGPVGELRDKDLGGRLVDSNAVFPSGSEGNGLAGLRTYIRDHRQDDFLENFCRELLAYGLGRTLLPSDDDLIAAMRAHLVADQYRFDGLIELIVTSPQFLNKRVNAEVTQKE